MKKIMSLALLLALIALYLLPAYAESTFQTVVLGEYEFEVPAGWSVEAPEDAAYYIYGGNNTPYDGPYIYARLSEEFDVEIYAENIASSFEQFFNGFCEEIGMRNIKEVSDINFAANSVGYRCVSGSIDIDGIAAETYTLSWATSESIYSIFYMRNGLTTEAMQNEFFPIVSSIKKHVHEDFPIKSYEYSRGDYYCLGLVITNASGEDTGFDVTVKFYDKSGAIVGISNDSNYIVANGAQAFFEMYNDIEFSSFDCEVSPMKKTMYTAVNDNLEIEKTIVGRKCIIAVTNTGDIPADFVKYNLLFMKNGDVVDTAWGYITDSDSEIKPGKTQYVEEKGPADFDDVLIYLAAKGKK